MPSTQLSRYAAIIDAGSSGSRLYVYQWPSVAEFRSLHVNDDKILNALPPIQCDETWSLKTQPGISSYASESEDKIWQDHLKSLVERAKSVVPEEEQYRTPVYFLATAGMRLLEETQQKDLLSKVCNLLQKNSAFYLPECSSHVNIIDGETEGLYGWLALNYLIDPSQTFSSDKETFGFMDMGGASSQIAFMPNASESQRHEEDLFRVSLRNVGGDLHKFDVFVSTWLGFGANESRKRLLNQLGSSHKSYDPCTSKGLVLPSGEHQFRGTGNFGDCLNEIKPLLNKGMPCKDDPCLFNGVHVPSIDFSREKFVGVSEYWYTANDVFNMGGKYDFYQFSKKAEAFCGLEWEEVLQRHANGDYGQIPADYLQHACFKAAWVVSILHEGFNVPLTKISNDDSKIGDDPEVESKVESADLLYDDPFQSAFTIHGKELSWTLGRAMLYASSEVVPSSDNSGSVGFLPADSSLFINGGELKHSVGSSFTIMPGTERLFPTLAIVSVVFIIVLAVYRVRHRIPYHKRLFTILSKPLHLFSSKKYEAISDDFAQDLDRMETGQVGIKDTNYSRSFSQDIPLRSYPSSPILLGPKKKRSYPQLGKSTSMLNLARNVPSRVSSRLNMRDSNDDS